MRVVVYETYGSPDVLRLTERPRPEPGPDELLVRIQAASLNSYDYDLLRGVEWHARMFGLRAPRNRILCTDVAGTVEAVGAGATKFEPGDRVCGDLSARWAGAGWGGLAEYVCTRETNLTRIPANMTFEQAAALPQTGALAVQGLREEGRLQSGESILINGAGGGVGTLAIQLAREIGAEITGVDRAGKLDLIAALGASRTIDFEREDFTESGERYDMILDMMSNRPVAHYARTLRDGGRYVSIGGPGYFRAAFIGMLYGFFSKKRIGVLGARANQGLEYLVELFTAGRLRPVLDERVFRLEDAAAAFRYFVAGDFHGKIIVKPT